ncbi:MAG: hypothetical protein IJH05_03650 [Firmicutes bacterium]|nr:hypothetical protein [Bacillota bacterium]
MNLKSVLLAVAFTAFITSSVIPVIQIWLPFSIFAGAVLAIAQEVRV